MSLRRATPEPPPAGALSLALAGVRVHVEVTVPGLAVRGKMRLVTMAEDAAIRIETRDALRAAGYQVSNDAERAITTEWMNELIVRTLAVAIREHGAPERALAAVEEWKECDEGQLAYLWQRYADLEREQDPIGKDAALTADDLAGLADAAKKKDARLLRLFGSVKLSAYVLTLAGQPSS